MCREKLCLNVHYIFMLLAVWWPQCYRSECVPGKRTGVKTAAADGSSRVQEAVHWEAESGKTSCKTVSQTERKESKIFIFIRAVKCEQFCGKRAADDGGSDLSITACGIRFQEWHVCDQQNSLQKSHIIDIKVKVKVKLSMSTPWRQIGRGG